MNDPHRTATARSAGERNDFSFIIAPAPAKTAFERDHHRAKRPVDAALIDLAVALTRRQKLCGCDAIQLVSALTLNASLTSQDLLPLAFVAADADLLAAAAAEGLVTEDRSSHL